MKLIRFFFTLVLIASIHTLSAQNWKVEAGKMEYKGGDYPKAIETLTDALQATSRLKSRRIVEANVYMALSYVKIASQYPNNRDSFPEALNRAVEYLNNAIELDKDKRFKKEIAYGKSFLTPALFNAGVLNFQDKKHPQAIAFLNQSANLNPGDYKPHLLLGYIYMSLQDTPTASSSLRKAIELHIANSSMSPDTLVAAAYLTLTELRLEKNDKASALKIIQEGRTMFPDNQDLRKTELHIYQQSPDQQEAAKRKFKQAHLADPTDMEIQLAYADILRKLGENNSSIKLYKGVLATQPDNYVANVNIAVFYINESASLMEQYKKTESEEDAKKIEKEISKKLKEGLPYLQKAHELDKENVRWVEQLVNVTAILKMDEENTEYMKLLAKLK